MKAYKITNTKPGGKGQHVVRPSTTSVPITPPSSMLYTTVYYFKFYS